jgi:GH24 family phage-related lysozyme (muramidase)
LVEQLHYAKGGSLTGVHFHGLFAAGSSTCVGVAWWLPPTRPAAESVNREYWRRVLALSRFVLRPEVPQNGASFLLARSVRTIEREQVWRSLVTYADESQGHRGTMYLAAGWTYVGRSNPNPRWVDPVTGRQVSVLATKSRTKAQMLALGYTNTGVFHKHKFVRHLRVAPQRDPITSEAFRIGVGDLFL